MSNEKDKISGIIGKDFGLGNLFKGLGDLVDLVQKMTEEGKDTYSKYGEISDLHQNKSIKGKYGFTVHMGTDTVGQLDKFRKLKFVEEVHNWDSVLEPLVDIYDEEDILIVVADVPGANEDMIGTSLEARELTLDIQGPQRKYWKKLSLPVEVDATPVAFSYNNGILELKFKKLA